MVQIFLLSKKYVLKSVKIGCVDKGITLLDILYNDTIFYVKKMIFFKNQISLDHRVFCPDRDCTKILAFTVFYIAITFS